VYAREYARASGVVRSCLDGLSGRALALTQGYLAAACCRRNVRENPSHDGVPLSLYVLALDDRLREVSRLVLDSDYRAYARGEDLFYSQEGAK
jgi:hypothetical protein